MLLLLPKTAFSATSSVGGAEVVCSAPCNPAPVSWKLKGLMPRMQAAARAQMEAEKRQKEDMIRRRSRLQASMAEVISPMTDPRQSINML